MSILDKQIVLRLNASWIPIGWITVRDAVVFLASESGNEKPGFALDYGMVSDENKNEVLAYANPTSWDDWITLPVRNSDLAINTAHGQIRVPLVIICAKYNRIPIRRPRASAGTIYARDKSICQYSGRKLTRAEMTLDHIIPRSRGGKDSFLNLVTCDRKINTLKADRTPEEAGLKLLKQPKEPPTMPVVITADEARHAVQRSFLI